jgi:hydrogenase maturation protein HypF
LDAEEEALLTGRERPIVLLARRERIEAARPLAEGVAPGNAFVGFMLPYAPLHHLLVENASPLVMTSGNRSDEPIARDNAEALERLATLADAFLLHDRPIHVVCDDSVVRVFEGHEAPVRRSRGYAPFPVAWPLAGPPLLAAGAELKATFCLTRPPYAYVSQHIGDMGNLETLAAFERAVVHFLALYRVEPSLVACDLHPDYLSTRWAERFAGGLGLPLERIQHHHAHAASVMVDHGLDGSRPVIGVILDGTGYGTDGAIWGGEVLLADYRGFQRRAYLKYVPLPGGDAAIKRPYRAALAHLWAAGIAWSHDLPCVAACGDPERRVLHQQLERDLHCVPTSSMGRLFDAVAALLGVRQTVDYEAQAAIEMESLSEDQPPAGRFELTDGDPILIDPAPVLGWLCDGLRRGVPSSLLAGAFHRAVAEMIAEVSRRIRERTGITTVALSGGVFQNMRLQRLAVERLQGDGFEVLTHRRVPANDGGLALGQAAIAAARALV